MALMLEKQTAKIIVFDETPRYFLVNGAFSVFILVSQ